MMFYRRSGSIVIIYDIKFAADQGTKVEEVHVTLKDVIAGNEAKLSANVTVEDVSKAYFVYGNESY